MKETTIKNSKCYHIELEKKYTEEYIDNDTINILYFPLKETN